MVLIAAILSLSACTSPKPAETPDGPFVRYSVSGKAVSIVLAVTPFDGEPEVSAAFLHWFQRGFETVLAGREPLRIEWDITPAAKAGRRGYDFGMDEAERYLKKTTAPSQLPQTVPIPPGGI
jgi:hypothetical protein